MDRIVAEANRRKRRGEARPCDVPGCVDPGEYRAPRSRQRRDGSYWFCLLHVRRYNAAWDFFAGMNPNEVETYLRANATGQRPTWRMGQSKEPVFLGLVFDDLGLLSELKADFTAHYAAPPTPPPVDAQEREALAALDLQPDASLQEIKSRYKELAKRYHPDANGGDNRAEERLKVINRAYAYLMTREYT
jgi:DnaJ domain